MQTLEEAGGVDGFVSPASFWFPEALPESAWHQHAPFAFWLMQALRPRSFVELGTHHGFSYLCLCQAAERLQLDARGYAVDTWQGDDHAGFYDGEVYARLRDLHDPRYGSFSRLVRSTFDEALPHFADKSIDLLHIDGRHFYDDVKHDFESWQGKLSDRAVVLFHDTNVRERGFGVFRYWAELRERYPAFEFLHGHGLGVLGVGRDLPELVGALLRGSDASLTRRVREAYARLGAAIEDWYMTARQEEKIGDLGRELAAARQEAEDKLSAADAHFKSLEVQATEDAKRLAQLSAELKQLQQAKDEADRQYTAQSVRIGELEQELLNSADQVAALTVGHREQHEKLTGSELQIGLMATKLNDLEKKSNSSRWLLKTVIKKIIHSPRDISRRWRKSWQKWCAADIPAIAAMKHPAFDLRLLRNAQYRKYASSWLVLRFERCIPRSFASRMRRRMEKHAPVRPVASPAKVWSIAPNWNLFEDLRSSAEHSLGEAAILDVIIPVYRGYDETLSCIYSVLSSRNTTPFELVVIDDSSPEPMLSEALDRLARMNLITLLRNEQNLGFVRTVNRGMSMHGSRDVLLLNSDTIVANDWLDRIRAHALLPNVASVTPFTNNGTICSYPEFCKDNPQELEVPFFQLDLMAATFNRNRFVEVPTGVGFCMYITRRALDKSGLFDAETFGRGYGEENDFCVKASKLGMRNLHALDVFVFHSGETSFGADSSRAKKNGLNALTSKYPDYLSEIAKYISADPAKEARVRLDIARMLKTEPKRLILCFTHTRGGGVERYLRDRALSVADTGEHLLLAVPNPAAPSTIRLTGVDGGLPLANLPEFDIIENENAFIELLKSLPVHVIEVHSSVGWSANLLRFVPRIASTLKIPFDFMAHDYVATCPQINLINESGIYCGERGEEQCRRCLIAAPATPHVVHPDMSDFGMDDIVTWRKNYHRFLKSARKVFAPSDDTAKRLQRYFSDISVTTHPPAENTQVHTRHVAKPYFGDILRVVVIGAIGPHKGSGILRACADDALRRDLPIHFIIVGTTNVHDLPSRRNVSITGPYSECEVFGRLAEIGAHVALLPSVWPETYCYTLSIAIAGGFPICAFDIGAPAQRLKSHPGMTLLPVSMMTDAAGINDALLRMISVGAMEALAS